MKIRASLYQTEARIFWNSIFLKGEEMKNYELI